MMISSYLMALYGTPFVTNHSAIDWSTSAFSAAVKEAMILGFRAAAVLRH